MTNEATSTSIYTLPRNKGEQYSRWIWKEELWFIIQSGCFTGLLVSGKLDSLNFHREEFSQDFRGQYINNPNNS